MSQKNTETKFTEDEMSTLSSIREAYADVQYKFGQAAIMKIRLEERIKTLNEQAEQLKKEYTDTQEKENHFLDEVNKKYGEGELNPETGEFTSK